MKVLIISHLYPSSLQPVYGTFVEDQAKELKRQGCEVKVIAPVKSAPFPINILNAKWRTLAGVPLQEERAGITVYHPRYVSLPRNILFDKTGEFLYQRIRKLVTEIKKSFDFDLIHAHVALPGGFAAMKISKELGTPYMVTIHGEDFFNKIFLNTRTKEAIQATLQGADKVFLVSERLKRVSDEHLTIAHDKLKVLHNGINEMFLEKSDTPKNHFHGDVIKVLSVGRLIEKKGVQYNLKALSELKEHPFHYIIAGDGPYRNQLENLTKELGLESKVTFLGSVKPAVVKELMEESNIFCLTSWDEAFGIVYIEAMASGNAVIGSLGEGAEEIITEGIDGFLVPTKQVEGIKSVFQLLFDDSNRMEELGANAVLKVKKSFTWEKNVSEMLKVYQEILNGD
ncbi:glycosyltransferase [Rossellomorea vietnamensis]|uniref:glycosyltransferase n=1 Tax=Rossellomorea vietnamensis TaxID=218284 RepID=UPI003CF711B0